MTTRDRVLEEALTGFAQRGYEATSLDSLAGELGVRKQTILYYFPSKDELLRGVILYATAELADVLGHSRRRPTATLASAAIVDSVFRVGARRPELIVLLREVSRLGPVASRDLAAAIEPLVAQAVTALAEVGSIRTDRAASCSPRERRWSAWRPRSRCCATSACSPTALAAPPPP